MTTFSDLSHHQAGVSVQAYAAAHDRIALKATEGLGYIDPTFAPRWRLAGELGLARVAYHYDRAVNDGASQFGWFLDAVMRAGGLRAGDMLCLDSEDTATPARASAAAAAFTHRAATLGYSGCVYTGRWYANPYGITAGVLHPSWRWLWLSDYTATHTDQAMPLPAGWDRAQVLARQFTDRATVPGVTGPCDYSRVLRDWLTTTEDDSMSAAEADRVIAAVEQGRDALYNLTRAMTPDGDPDPGHAEQAVTTVNKRIAAVGNQLAAVAGQVNGQGIALGRLAGAVEAVVAGQQALADAIAAIGRPVLAGTVHVAGDLQVTEPDDPA